MIRQVYIFNPEHDLALANTDPNFNAPKSAIKMGTDLSVIPLWYCNAGSTIIINKTSTDWVRKQKNRFVQIRDISTDLTQTERFTLQATPWGWDNAIRKRLSQLGIPPINLASNTEILKVHELSHRRQAIALHNYIKQNAYNTELIPTEATEILTLEALKQLVTQQPATILKAPYSGSGKGICWVNRTLDKSKTGWAKNILTKQGSLIAEKVYTNVQDFAMLFNCHNGITHFVGYSLFETKNGIYRSNSLLSNEHIESKILSLGISLSDLIEIQTLIRTFSNQNIAPHYNGIAGVDMFLFTEEGTTKLHPSVEINLRMTMGMLARTFYDRFVSPNSEGRLHIDYSTKPNELLQDHKTRSVIKPLEFENNKIKKGYFCASDLTSESNYRLRIEISTNS